MKLQNLKIEDWLKDKNNFSQNKGIGYKKNKRYKAYGGCKIDKMMINKIVIPKELINTDFGFILEEIWGRLIDYKGVIASKEEFDNSLKAWKEEIRHLFFIRWGLGAKYSYGQYNTTTWGKDGVFLGTTKEQAKKIYEEINNMKSWNEITYSVKNNIYKDGGNIKNISKQLFYKVVSNWVYFTFNYPYNFWQEAFNSKHLSEKFDLAYKKHGSQSAVMQFWSQLDSENTEKLIMYVKNKYFNSEQDKEILKSTHLDVYSRIIKHWNKFCFNYHYNFVDEVFDSEHFKNKFELAIERGGNIGGVNVFFAYLSNHNQEKLTNWVYENYKGNKMESGGKIDVETLKSKKIWELTRAEWEVLKNESIRILKNNPDFAKSHRESMMRVGRDPDDFDIFPEEAYSDAIKKAIKEGKPVPENVLLNEKEFIEFKDTVDYPSDYNFRRKRSVLGDDSGDILFEYRFDTYCLGMDADGYGFYGIARQDDKYFTFVNRKGGDRHLKAVFKKIEMPANAWLKRVKNEIKGKEEIFAGGGKFDRGYRPSPKYSATLFDLGDEMQGQDGNLYRVAEDSRGIKRWQKIRYQEGGNIKKTVYEIGNI